MAQHDMNLANGSGAAFRADLNDALSALATCFSGATAPTTTFPFMFWADTANNLLKQRNAANSGWISVLTLSTGKAVALDAGAISLAASKLIGRNSGGAGAAQEISLGGLEISSSGVLAPMSGFRNLLINPSGGRIYQRAVASTADDTYFADRWYALTESGNITPSVLTDPENGYPDGCRLTQPNATAQRYGFAQIVEGKNCKMYRGSSGVLAPRIRASGSVAIRYAVLGWTGTEDAVTSDVVLNWASASFTAGGFFLASNVSVLAVGSSTPSANTWTTLPSIAGALGSTFNNLIVMVWTESAQAQNFTLDFDWVQLEKGAIATPADWRQFEIEFAWCQRYYHKVQASLSAPYCNGFADTTVIGRGVIDFPVDMRVAPTVIETSGTAADYRIRYHGGNAAACSAIPVHMVAGKDCAAVAFTIGSGVLTAGSGVMLEGNSSSSFIAWSVEL